MELGGIVLFFQSSQRADVVLGRWGAVSIGHIQALCIHLRLHFQQPHEVDGLRLMLQARKLESREIKSLPRSHSANCVNITMPGTQCALKRIVLNVERIFQGSNLQHPPRASNICMSFEPVFYFQDLSDMWAKIVCVCVCVNARR